MGFSTSSYTLLTSERKAPIGIVLGICAFAISCWYFLTAVSLVWPNHELDAERGGASFSAVLDGIVNDISGKIGDGNSSLAAVGAAKEFGQNDDLILYSYSESEEALYVKITLPVDSLCLVHETEADVRRSKNLLFFRTHALHAKADFIFILNGAHTLPVLPELSHLPNVRVIQRPNTCFDLGAYWEVLSAKENFLAHAYKRYLFINASLRGPFLPSSARKVCWSDAYLDMLDEQRKVGLVGMTWNCARTTEENFPPHLQSMIWGIDAKVLNEVVLPNLKCFETMSDTVTNGETVMTSKVLDAGYEVAAMEGRFASHSDLKGKDGGSKKFLAWCNGDVNPEGTGRGSDVNYSGNYGGVTISPWDTM